MTDILSQLQGSIRAAIAAKQALRIRGGGSKDFYGEAFDAATPVLDTRSYSGIVSYEPSELVMTVKAGTSLAEVEAALAEKNQCFPFEPPHYSVQSWLESLSQPLHENSLSLQAEGRGEGMRVATIGGMVAAGLSGPARATVGSVRDYVLGAHLINGKAELLQFGGTVMKNVAGYDVSRALAGSMGTLGLITQVSLKVLPVAPAEATLRFDMSEAAMIQTVNTWAGQPLPINASSWVVDQGRGVLYLRLRGAVAAVDSACAMFSHQHGGQRVDSAQTTADWAASRDLKLPWFAQGFKRGEDLWRISVPPTTAPLNLGDSMIDWLGGQRWVFAPAGDLQAAERMRAAAQAVKGSATKFIAFGAGFIRANSQNSFKNRHFSEPNAVVAGIHRRLKQEFDPAGIFNPGRLGVI
jgi:glycolate oxidase FAD binding subunit